MAASRLRSRAFVIGGPRPRCSSGSRSTRRKRTLFSRWMCSISSTSSSRERAGRAPARSGRPPAGASRSPVSARVCCKASAVVVVLGLHHVDRARRPGARARPRIIGKRTCSSFARWHSTASCTCLEVGARARAEQLAFSACRFSTFARQRDELGQLLAQAAGGSTPTMWSTSSATGRSSQRGRPVEAASSRAISARTRVGVEAALGARRLERAAAVAAEVETVTVKDARRRGPGDGEVGERDGRGRGHVSCLPAASDQRPVLARAATMPTPSSLMRFNDLCAACYDIDNEPTCYEGGNSVVRRTTAGGPDAAARRAARDRAGPHGLARRRGPLRTAAHGDPAR